MWLVQRVSMKAFRMLEEILRVIVVGGIFSSHKLLSSKFFFMSFFIFFGFLIFFVIFVWIFQWFSNIESPFYDDSPFSMYTLVWYATFDNGWRTMYHSWKNPNSIQLVQFVSKKSIRIWKMLRHWESWESSSSLTYLLPWPHAFTVSFLVSDHLRSYFNSRSLFFLIFFFLIGWWIWY